MNSNYRKLAAGMGEAVARRTILRRLNTPQEETWGDVADRVADGNASIHPSGAIDRDGLRDHIAQGRLLMSGRSLQHGQIGQPSQALELYSNCATAASSHALFLLLLSGSGVGRSYDDALMIVDWSANLPRVLNVISPLHPDFDPTRHTPNTNYLNLSYDNQHLIYHRVADSREGWAQAVELVERLTWAGHSYESGIVLDYSGVRPSGSPIQGMQGRPASGPAPLMEALTDLAALRGSEYAPWKATLFADHYLAQCVVVGGARRSARMSTKVWTDPDAVEFARIKAKYGLWSSNNSLGVDGAFWAEAEAGVGRGSAVFEAAINAAYHDGTGEPGFINLDRLTHNDHNVESIRAENLVRSERFQPHPETVPFYAALLKAALGNDYQYVTNPCGEIPLRITGGYCVLCDVVPFHCDDLDQAEDAVRHGVRAAIRLNQLDALYSEETRRTNRIGIGLTGVHEFAWKFFSADWFDLLNDAPGTRGGDFWAAIERLRDAAEDEAQRYSNALGVAVPHTVTTVKPSGSVSKLFALTEGIHLPALRYYLRNVQFRSNDPLVAAYQAKGYPSFESKTYAGTTVVGFPTVPTITTVMPPAFIVTAAEATPQDQYAFLRLIEQHWFGESRNAQASYTLKVDVDAVSFEDFRRTVLDNQKTVRGCAVMPFSSRGLSAFEYLPEQPVSETEMLAILEGITDQDMKQDIDISSLQCASGSCPL